MRICLHTIWPIEHNFVGGTERFLVDAAKALRRYGFDVFVVCSNTTSSTEIEGVQILGHIPEEYAAKLKKFGNNPTQLIKRELYGDLATYDKVQQLNRYVQMQLSAFTYDVVHLNTFSSSLFDKPPTNTLLTIHENPEELDEFWHEGAFMEIAKLISTSSKQLPHQTYAPTQHYAKMYSGMFNKAVVSNPIGVPWTNVGVLPKRGHTTGNRILLPARFFPQQKGQDILIEALGLLRKKRADFAATLTGADMRYQKEVKAAQKRIVELNLSGLVSIKLTNRIEEEFRTHDIAVSPEQYCSYGISIREAASMGLKLVLSDIPPHRELEADYLDIKYFDKNSPEQCAICLDSALNQTQEAASNTIKFRLKNDFDSNIKCYAEKYLSLCGECT